MSPYATFWECVAHPGLSGIYSRCNHTEKLLIIGPTTKFLSKVTRADIVGFFFSTSCTNRNAPGQYNISRRIILKLFKTLKIIRICLVSERSFSCSSIQFSSPLRIIYDGTLLIYIHVYKHYTLTSSLISAKKY